MFVAQRAAASVLLAVAAALLPERGDAVAMQLIDQRGHHFMLSDLLGAPLVVTFVSAHCTDVCPIVNAMTADAIQRARSAHVKARFLTITLDPEHDSLADMRGIAKRFSADPRQWVVAGGAAANVRAVMRAFGVIADRAGAHVEHSTLFYIVDANGRISRTLLVSADISTRLVAAIRAAESE